MSHDFWHLLIIINFIIYNVLKWFNTKLLKKEFKKNETSDQQRKTKHHTNEVRESTLILTVNVGGGGWRISIRQMTNSFLRTAFLRSASTPSLFYTTATFRARPLILMGTIQCFAPSYPSLHRCLCDDRFWPDSLSWLTLKKPPQKSLCQPRLTSSPQTLFSSPSFHTLD